MNDEQALPGSPSWIKGRRDLFTIVLAASCLMAAPLFFFARDVQGDHPFLGFFLFGAALFGVTNSLRGVIDADARLRAHETPTAKADGRETASGDASA